MIRVRFLKVWRMYQPGETAGFDPAMADQIVAGGFAVAVGDEEVPVAKPKAKADAAAKAAADAKAKEEADAAAKAAEGQKG